MAYDQQLADRIRTKLASLPSVVEKEMMGGLTFMYNDKMCVGVIKDELMCRIDPKEEQNATAKPGCRQMDFTGKPMKGYILIEPSGIDMEEDFDYFIQLALDFNKIAKSSKKKKS